MNDLTTLYRLTIDPTVGGLSQRLMDAGVLVPVEPVDTTDMIDDIDGWFEVGKVYAPDLPKAQYRVMIVVIDDE